MKEQIRTHSINWGLILTTIAVALVGILNLYSASRDADTNMAFIQAVWLAIGVGLAIGMSLIDYRILEQLAYPLLISIILMLIFVLVAGKTILGAKRWINLGFFNLQPSELAKIILIITLAKYFYEEQSWPPEGYTLRLLIKPLSVFYPLGGILALVLFWENLPLGDLRFLLLVAGLLWAAGSLIFYISAGQNSLHDMLSPLILVFIPAILIMKQPDLGTSLILLATAGTMMLFVKVKSISLFMAAGLLVVIAIGSWNFLQPYQKNRILSFTSKNEDTKNTGYHARQSLIAVGSGKITGKGYGESTQTQFRFLPEQHTDFVFSVWAEEWGFTGCLGALGLFFLWLAQIINAASHAKEKFGMLLGVGVAAMVFWHTIINIGMVIGLLPVVGITLPLWSYGGSSMLAFMIGVGLLMSVSSNRLVF